MAVSVITQEDFDQLQNQIIELRTKNYDLESKLNKTENEKHQIQEKCNSQEKELHKVGKIMKFPGFQAMRNSKSKKDLAELLDENERLNNQLQRQEEDFKLQSQTFREEISRLADVNDKLQNQQSNSNSTSSSDEDSLRLQAENSVLLKTVEDLKARLSGNDTDNNESESQQLKDDILTKLSDIQTEILNKLESNRSDDSSTKVDSMLNNDVENTDNHYENSSGQNESLDYRDMLEQYFISLKSLLNQYNLKENETNNDSDFKLQAKMEELSILQDKLNSHKESSKKEIQELRDEISKLTEKTRKKQESLLQLQEEKEKSYEENRLIQKQLKKEKLEIEEELKSQIVNLGNQVKQYEESNQKDQTQAMLDIVRSENQALQEQLIGLKEKEKDEENMKIKDLQEKLQHERNEKSELEKTLQVKERASSVINEKMNNFHEQVHALNEEISSLEEIAEKRKVLLDQASLEHHQAAEAHQAKLEELKKNYDIETENLVAKHSTEIEDLKKQVVGNKKLKREIEENKQTITKLEEEIEIIQKKAGWLERTLQETEEKLEIERKEREEKFQQTNNEHETEISTLKNNYDAEVQKLNDEIASFKEQSIQNENIIAKLKQAAIDKEVEYRIATKKLNNMLKDLRRQCNSERRRADQIQLKLQDFIQEIKVKQTYDEIFNPESLQLKVAAASGHKRQDSGSHLSLVSSLSGTDTDDIARSAKTSSPVESATSLVGGMSDETMDLITRITNIQQEKWQLEEKVRHLEENGAVMADDLMQKSLIIKSYVMDSRGDATPQKTRSLTLKDKMLDKLKLHNNDELNREMATKMQRMLEETLARNVQLQKDLDMLSGELQKEKEKSTTNK